jgi:2-oxoglutarate dehydrogenase E1 component
VCGGQVQLLVRAFQVRGHSIASLDPLGISKAVVPPELTIENYGWSEKDLDKEMELGAGILPWFKEAGHDKMTLRKVVETCRQIYCESPPRLHTSL